MALEVKKVGELDQVPFKENLMISVSDPDIPEGPTKASKRVDLGDVRPKIIPWDVTTQTLPATAKNGDHLEVTVADTYDGIVFGIGGMAIVTNVSTGKVIAINTALGGYPVLTAFNITSAYPSATAEGQTYTRTGFKSGDTVNFSFTASEAINKIAIWPFDAELVEGMPSGTPVVVDVTGASGTGSFVIPNAIGGNNAYVASGQLYAAVRAYGDYTDRIQSTGSFLFDNRLPAVSLADVTYPATQGAIKSTEAAAVRVALTGSLAGYLKGALVDGEAVQAVTQIPTNGVHNTTGLSEFTFNVRRNTAEFASFEGEYVLAVRAYNRNNGKMQLLNVLLHLEPDSFAAPVAVMNAGDKVATAVGGKAVAISITSTVRLASPNGFVSIPGATNGVWSTNDDGYTWVGIANVADNAPRGVNNIVDTGMVSSAGTPITLTGSYTVSGFDERAVSFAGSFSPYAPLAPVTVDHEPFLVVKNVLGAVINPSLYSYDALNNRIVVDASIANLNSTGQLYLYVSQESAP